MLAGLGIRILKNYLLEFSGTSKFNYRALDKTLDRAKKCPCKKKRVEKIERGEYPVKETMISGNVFEMLSYINSISKEKISFPVIMSG